jgi:hypothetical protein
VQGTVFQSGIIACKFFFGSNACPVFNTLKIITNIEIIDKSVAGIGHNYLIYIILLAKNSINKKSAFIAAAKSRRKTDIFERNNAINVTPAGRFSQVANC